MAPLQVGGEQARNVDDPSEAVAQLQSLGQERWPDLSPAQQFSRAFAAHPELAAKAHRRPAATTIFPHPR
jgi:hypothetical protein